MDYNACSMRKLLTTILLAAWLSSLYAQMVINEAVTGNDRSILDEDGDSPDWFELYNAGASAVNLLDHGITDDVSDLYKWRFPSVTVNPGDHLLVFASGKDRGIGFDHWVTAVRSSDTWRWLAPSSEPDSTW